MNSERGEDPTFDAVVAEHLRIADVVLVGLWFALDVDAEHCRFHACKDMKKSSILQIILKIVGDLKYNPYLCTCHVKS